MTNKKEEKAKQVMDDVFGAIEVRNRIFNLDKDLKELVDQIRYEMTNKKDILEVDRLGRGLLAVLNKTKAKVPNGSIKLAASTMVTLMLLRELLLVLEESLDKETDKWVKN